MNLNQQSTSAQRIVCLSVGLALAVSVFNASACRAKDFDGKVVKVADGDTITVLDGFTPIRLRLASIDAPEKSQAYGRRAGDFMAQLVLGKSVHVRDLGKDKYRRTIGEVNTSDGKNVNQEAVASGYAWLYRRFSNDAELARLESIAKSNRRGLWADANPVAPWDFRKLERRARKYKTAKQW